MAEIGLIASIVSVAGAGAKISITLFQIASSLGSAGYEVRFVAADTSALSLVLTNLSNTLRVRRAAANEGELIAGAVLSLCRTVIQDSEELLSHLSPLVTAAGSTASQTLLRLRWLFEKSKFATHRQSLEALKTTLTLLITTMSFSAAVNNKAPDSVSESLRAQVESLKAQIEVEKQEIGDVTYLIHKAHVSNSDRLLHLSPSSASGSFIRRKPAPSREAEETVSSMEIALRLGDCDNDKDAAVAKEYGSINAADMIPLLEITMLQRRAVQYAGLVLSQPVKSQEEADSWTRWTGIQDPAPPNPVQPWQHTAQQSRPEVASRGLENVPPSSTKRNPVEEKLEQSISLLEKQLQEQKLKTQLKEWQSGLYDKTRASYN